MKTIELLHGELALVSDEDYENLVQFNWSLTPSGYVRRTKPEAMKGCVYMHHDVVGHAPVGFEVEHIDQNKRNNQRCNLTFISKQLNQQRKNSGRNTTGFVGIKHELRTGKWTAQIRLNDKAKHLGTFKTPEDAAKAYDDAAFATYGLSAKLNFSRIVV